MAIAITRKTLIWLGNLQVKECVNFSPGSMLKMTQIREVAVQCIGCFQ